MLEHLTDILVGTAVAILTGAIFGVWRVSTRARDNTAALGALRAGVDGVRAEVDALQEALALVAVIDERCKTRCQTDQERSDRNDAAHERIERGMQQEHKDTTRLFEKLEKNIEAARAERVEQMKTLKADLVREFRKNGNGGH